MLDSESYDLTKYQVMAMRAAELVVNVWLMGSAVNVWPPEVQDNWEEKIDGIIEWCEKEILEIHQFGEAFDEPSS